MLTALFLPFLLASPALSLPNLAHNPVIAREADPAITPAAIYNKRTVDELLKRQNNAPPKTICGVPGEVSVGSDCCTPDRIYDDPASGKKRCCDEKIYKGVCGDNCEGWGLAVLKSGACCERAHTYQKEGTSMLFCCTAQVVGGKCTSNGG